MMTSSEVIGGNFALDWLFRREEIPFYEGGDDSPGALERTVDSITRLGERIQFPLEPSADWLRAGLKACLEPPRAGLRGTLSDLAQRRLGLNFVSHLRRTRLVPWVQGFLLNDLLQDYFFWCRRERIPWLRLQKKDIEAFAVYRSQSVLLRQRRDRARHTSRHGLVCRVSGNRHCDIRPGSRTDQAGLSAAIRGRS